MKTKFNTYLKYISYLFILFLYVPHIHAENNFQINNIKIYLDTNNSNNIRNIAIQDAEITGIKLLASSVFPELTKSTIISASPTIGASSIDPYNFIKSI